MTFNYTPPAPKSKEYLAKIVSTKTGDNATYIYYDFAVGDSVGWAHQVYIQTGKWPLIQRIDAKTGTQVLHILFRCAGVKDITAAEGHMVSINVEVINGYAYIRRIHPASHYHITPADIMIGTQSWGSGTDDMIRATYLASLSGLPVLQCDSRERESPMIEWCAEHEVVLLPSFFAAGDYTATGSNVIVDRKQGVEELIHNFITPINAASYHIAAMSAATKGKQLIYVTGIGQRDIHTLDDLPGHKWDMPKLGIVTGDKLRKILVKHKNLHKNVDFIFVEKNQICQQIYDLISAS